MGFSDKYFKQPDVLNLNLVPVKPPRSNISEILSLPIHDAIRHFGHNGECLKIKTPAGIVYWVLDEALSRWKIKKNGEIRVCFTCHEIALFFWAYRTWPTPETFFADVIQPTIEAKKVFPGLRIEGISSREHE